MAPHACIQLTNTSLGASLPDTLGLGSYACCYGPGGRGKETVLTHKAGLPPDKSPEESLAPQWPWGVGHGCPNSCMRMLQLPEHETRLPT